MPSATEFTHDEVWAAFEFEERIYKKYLLDEAQEQRTAEEVRTILRGISCDHRRMRAAPCNECRKSGRFCQIVTCPDCGLSWDNSEGTHG